MSEHDSPVGLFQVKRPTRAETAKSLLDKGFTPFKASAVSSYSFRGVHNNSFVLNDVGAEPALPPRRSSPQRAEVRLLAEHIAELTQCPVNDRGKFAGLWASLLRDYSFKDLITITNEAWVHRGELLNERYPTFTVFSVDHYAKFKHKNHLPPPNPADPQRLKQLIMGNRNADGTVDVTRLRRAMLLCDVPWDSNIEAMLLDFGVRPDELHDR